MKNTSNSTLTDSLNVDYQEESGLWMTNGCTLRKIVGILGIALPLLLWLFLMMVSTQDTPLPSISHYYYTRAGGIFTIVLSLLAIFLIVYKGKEPVDFYLSSIAGVFALCVILFPTSNLCDSSVKDCVFKVNGSSVTMIAESSTRELFHYISAGIFLVCLAYMALFLFTKSDKDAEHRGAEKITRNRIYRVCGVLMVLSILIMVTGKLLGMIYPSLDAIYETNNMTFWMECLAVESFGFAWLVKGEVILKDTPAPTPAPAKQMA